MVRAYDETLRNVSERDVREAIKEYERAHWGQKGNRKPSGQVVADPRHPLTELGALVAVVYRTRKGNDRVLTDYEHGFNTKRLPILAYERRTTLLVITGGMYHVNERGIID